MLEEFLQDQAALYVSGAMTAPERDAFEVVAEFRPELGQFIAGLKDVGAAIERSAPSLPAEIAPRPILKTRLRELAAGRPQQAAEEPMVVTSPEGLVQWINPAFVAMCGHMLEELHGRKLGPILQGPGTDRAAAERMRQAVHEYRACRETILNYHKDGRPYWVDIAITPFSDGEGQPLYMVAREREVVHRPVD